MWGAHIKILNNFRIFLQFITNFPSSSEKEKGKDSTGLGRFQPRRPNPEEKAPALAALRKRPWGFTK
jgi:hypothetical protein